MAKGVARLAELQVTQWIDRKRHGGQLSDQEMEQLVLGFSAGQVPDYQMSAFLMATCLRGLDEAETAAMTRAMMHSGDVLTWDDVPGPIVDKHSTGGVADTTTLILAPLLRALGARVAKLSGRGLGHTGGTLDKLESIPGLRTDLTPDDVRRLVREVGIAVAGQNARLAPADGAMYALRDVTATVQSPELIAASVMSKKLAGGAPYLILDVKVGSGALVPTVPEGEDLARRMVSLGTRMGRSVHAVLTAMDRPLGDAIGNAIEVEAAVDVLKGHERGTLGRLCVALAGRLAAMAGIASGVDAGEEKARQALSDGSALEAFARWVKAQGGNPKVADDPAQYLPKAELHEIVASGRPGFVTKFEARAIGEAAHLLGAGRARKGDRIDPGAGVRLLVPLGERVAEGEPLAELYTSDPGRIPLARKRFLEAVEIGDQRPERQPLLLSEVDRSG